MAREDTPAAAGTDDAIELSGVEKRYGGVVALDGVDIAFEPGTLHCLVGPNGSGKTTLVRLVLGLTRPTAGTVSVPPGARLGAAFQRPSHYPSLTVAENLNVFGAFTGADAARVATVVESLGLDPVLDRPAGEVSGGYARRLDLALALAKDPDFALLDEPTADLDAATRERALDVLADCCDSGGGVVVATHRPARFADRLDRLTVLHRGRVVTDEPREALPGDLQRFYVEQVLDADGPE